jgi:hypothetical protein
VEASEEVVEVVVAALEEIVEDVVRSWNMSI